MNGDVDFRGMVGFEPLCCYDQKLTNGRFGAVYVALLATGLGRNWNVRFQAAG